IGISGSPGCGRVSGLLPGPASTTAWPSLDPAGQVPAFASVSPHCGTPAMIAEIPCGDLNDTVSIRCWPSGRVRCMTNGVKPPASVVVVPAVGDGENGRAPDGQAAPPGPSAIAKLAFVRKSGAWGLLHGVRSALVVYVLHLVGVASVALLPPSKWRWKSLNGCCAMPEATPVTWPVVSFSFVCRTSLRLTPSAEAAISSLMSGGCDGRTYTFPVTCFSGSPPRSGVSIVTVPTFAAGGQDAGPSSSSPFERSASVVRASP